MFSGLRTNSLFYILEKGEKLDLTDTEVNVEVGLHDITMSDNAEEGGAQGNIISLIYKSEYYRYIVRTENEEDYVLAAVAIDKGFELRLIVSAESALFIMLIFTQCGVNGINSAAKALGVLLGNNHGHAQNAQALYQHCGLVQHGLCFVNGGHQLFLKVDAYCDSVFGSESHSNLSFQI